MPQVVWILEVLTDIERFARSNGLVNTADAISSLDKLVLVEIEEYGKKTNLRNLDEAPRCSTQTTIGADLGKRPA